MKVHEVELCYAWQETEEGVYHAFEVVDAELSVDYNAVAEKLAGMLDTTPQDKYFCWNSMRVSIPESVVKRIQLESRRLAVKMQLGGTVAEANRGSEHTGMYVSPYQNNGDGQGATDE